MDPAVGAATIAGAFALAVAGVGLIRPSGEIARYRRWVEIRKDAIDDIQAQIADAQIRRYVLGFAVADRTRKTRRRQYLTGAALLALAAIFAFFWITSTPTPGQWLYGGLALLSYIGGLTAISALPQRTRDKAVSELDQWLATLASDAAVTAPGTDDRSPTVDGGDATNG